MIGLDKFDGCGGLVDFDDFGLFSDESFGADAIVQGDDLSGCECGGELPLDGLAALFDGLGYLAEVGIDFT